MAFLFGLGRPALGLVDDVEPVLEGDQLPFDRTARSGMLEGDSIARFHRGQSLRRPAPKVEAAVLSVGTRLVESEHFHAERAQYRLCIG